MIAEYAGLSQSTVSMILSNKPHVSFSSETKQRVFDAAKELGYVKKTKKEEKQHLALEKTIMIICPLLSNGYYTMMIHSIATRAREYGYDIFVAPTMRNAEIEDSYLNMFSSLNLSGIIYLYPPIMVEKANHLSKLVPMVSIGDKSPDSQFDSVELDSKKPGFLLGEYLISLGHTHVTYVSSPISDKEIGRLSRLEGLQKAFKKHGLPISNVDFICSDAKTYTSYPENAKEYSNGYSLTQKVLHDKRSVTALIGNNDMTAFGIMGALMDAGYRIPQDYSVCGFDNIPLSRMPQISLTTIEHASIVKGEEAVDLIYRKNATRNSSSSNYNFIMRLEYEPQLIIRNSTGKRKKKY